MSEQTIFEKFLLWENAGSNVISTKKAYIDMTGGDLIAGIVLSEIIFWHLPNKEGKSKLRVQHDGKYWIAIRRSEWWERCRVTERQSDKALKILTDCGIIEKDVYKFNGEPTVHVRVIEEIFLKAWNNAVAVPMEIPFSPNRKNAPISPNSENEITKPLDVITKLSIPLTDLTTPLTTDSTTTDTVEFSEIATYYQNNYTMITAATRDWLNSIFDTYPPRWIMDALEKGVMANVRKPNYVEAILKDWQANGRDAKKPERKQYTPQNKTASGADALEQYAKEIGAIV